MKPAQTHEPSRSWPALATLALGLTLLAAPLAACGGTASPAPSPELPPAGPATVAATVAATHAGTGAASGGEAAAPGEPVAPGASLPPGRITVLAAASLTDAFREIGAAFEAAHPGAGVDFSFAGSQQLATQVREGVPADLVAFAGMAPMDQLVSEGAIDADAPSRFAGNRLAIAVPADNPAALADLADLARPGLKLVLAAPEVPVGRYAAELLDKAATLPGYPSDFAAAVGANAVSYEDDVRSVLGKVALGEADAGIVYQSDLRAAGDTVLGIEIPREANIPATYPLAPLREAARPDLAQAFAAFVLAPEGQAILARHGFTAAP